LRSPRDYDSLSGQASGEDLHPRSQGMSRRNDGDAEMDREHKAAPGGYLPDIYRVLRAAHPEVLEVYDRLAVACRDAGPLSTHEQRLVKLGIAIGMSSEGGVRSHVRRGLDEGIDPDALRHAIVLAIPTAGFPATAAAYEWAGEVLDHRVPEAD
jgi:alkylhydroperoxidase/carboxymuconolactone decarboxylase family protein YurZ